ncbi:hypothetical protein Tco_0919687 [Tanacetum coccineum]
MTISCSQQVLAGQYFLAAFNLQLTLLDIFLDGSRTSAAKKLMATAILEWKEQRKKGDGIFVSSSIHVMNKPTVVATLQCWKGGGLTLLLVTTLQSGVKWQAESAATPCYTPPEVVGETGVCNPFFSSVVFQHQRHVGYNRRGLEQREHNGEAQVSEAYSTVGIPDYIAPEVPLKKGYSLKCDWLAEASRIHWRATAILPSGSLHQHNIKKI